MKKIFNILLTIALLLAGGLGLSVPAHAEETATPLKMVQISPTLLRITLRGGSIIEDGSDECPEDSSAGCAVEIKNTGTQDFRYRVYATPYRVTNENNDVSFSEADSTSYTQVSRWIKFLNADGEYVDEVYYNLPAGESQLVYFKIEVPDDVPGGSQYAAVWAEVVDDAVNSGVQAKARAGSVISGRSIGTTSQDAEVLEYDFTRFTFGGSLHAEATVKNTGNTDFYIHHTYTARTVFGKELYTDDQSVLTYPENEYHLNADWENPPLLGIFQVEYRLSGSGLNYAERHIVVVMPIFVMVLLILLLTVIIVWTIIIIRKRKERKARTLV